MRRIAAGALGALAGLAFSTMGMIEFRDGIVLGGGNEATPFVIVTGVLLGALLGATALTKWPIAMAGVTIGLWTGMYLRDNADDMGTVQPPMVFLLLFGLPALGAALGYLAHLLLSRRTKGT